MNMLISLKIENSFIFQNEVEFSLKADMRNKRFSTNVHHVDNFHVLKVAAVYGPNNVGKTCLIDSIRWIKYLLLDMPFSISSNWFTESRICSISFRFLEKNHEYEFSIKYHDVTQEFIYESFSEIIKDQYSNEKIENIYIKDHLHKIYESKDKENLNQLMPVVNKKNLLIHAVETESFLHLNEAKNILLSFANKIEIVDMNNIPIEKTIQFMKSDNEYKNDIINFIKNADLDLDTVEYVDENEILDHLQINSKDKPQENVLNIPEKLIEQVRLQSVYHGFKVPSLFFDSTGTKKIMALASYVIESLKEGKILIIDEIDSSIHFKLTRAIVSMFNNELNKTAQLVFSSHDIGLMDCAKLFRKEQIWFIHKDEQGVYLYSLAAFTAKDGVRETTDIIEKYKKGLLGSIPDPKLIDTLISVQGGKDE